MLYIRATRLSITIKEGIDMTVLFLLYAGIIPAVPLIGAEIYKRRNDNTRRSVCSVSYTHLDVYKRQGEERRRRLSVFALSEPISSFGKDTSNLAFFVFSG